MGPHTIEVNEIFCLNSTNMAAMTSCETHLLNKKEHLFDVQTNMETRWSLSVRCSCDFKHCP